MFPFDAFAPEITFWQQIGGFLLHLIPSFIMIALLIVAWKWEYIGGIIFTIPGFGFSVAVFLLNYNRNAKLSYYFDCCYSICACWHTFYRKL